MDKNLKLGVIEQRINDLQQYEQTCPTEKEWECETEYSRLHDDLKKMAAFYVRDAIEQKIINVDLDALNSEAKRSVANNENLSKLIVRSLQQKS